MCGDEYSQQNTVHFLLSTGNTTTVLIKLHYLLALKIDVILLGFANPKV